MMYVGICNEENVNSLPNSVGIVTRQDTKMWLSSYMANITSFSRIDLSGVRHIQPCARRLTENNPRGRNNLNECMRRFHELINFSICAITSPLIYKPHCVVLY